MGIFTSPVSSTGQIGITWIDRLLNRPKIDNQQVIDTLTGNYERSQQPTISASPGTPPAVPPVPALGGTPGTSKYEMSANAGRTATPSYTPIVSPTPTEEVPALGGTPGTSKYEQSANAAANAARRMTATPATMPATTTPQPPPATPADNLVPSAPQPYQSYLFQNVPEGMGEAYQQTLMDSLTGKIYDPFAAARQETLAQQERNKRAQMANRIAGAGFGGQGIGEQAAAGLEDVLAQQRAQEALGIEQARAEVRAGALGEARTYAGVEQAQAKDALAYALDFGNDADVAAAYKNLTGQDIDPMSVNQYRGYLRTMTEQTIESNQVTLDALKRTEAGSNLASMVQNHPDWGESPEQAWADPTFRNAAQEAWTAQGGQGQVPQDWAMKQVSAITDPRLTNPVAAMIYQIDQIPDDVMDAETKDLAKKAAAQGFFDTKFWKRNDDGTVSFDWDAYSKANAPSTVVNVSQGTTVGGAAAQVPRASVPTKPDGTTYQPGENFTQEGTRYVVDQAGNANAVVYDEEAGDTPWGQKAADVIALGETGNNSYALVMDARVADLKETPSWENLQTLKAQDATGVYYQKALENIKQNDISSSSFSGGNGTNYVSTKMKRGDAVNITVNGEKKTVRVAEIGKIDLRGLFGAPDGAYVMYEDESGNRYFQYDMPHRSYSGTTTVDPGNRVDTDDQIK